MASVLPVATWTQGVWQGFGNYLAKALVSKMPVALRGANDRIVALLDRRNVCRASKQKY
jgi:hypothetical protein